MIRGGWIGVDLDGVLAVWHEATFPQIGPPIQPMIDRVRGWIAEGKEVRIFTARVGPATAEECGVYDFKSSEEWTTYQRGLIDTFCHTYFGGVLPVTATKDFKMIELWDDRCVQMEINTGRPILESLQLAARELKP